MRKALLILFAFALTASAATKGSDSPVLSWVGPDEPRIVIVNSYHAGFWWSDEEQRGVIDGLRERWPTIQPAVEYLDLKRFPHLENETNFVSYVARKYEGVRFDLSIFLDDPGLKAAEKHPYLVAYAPVIYCGVAQDRENTYTTFTNSTGVIEDPAVEANLRLIDRLIPDLREIHVLAHGSNQRSVELHAQRVFGDRSVKVVPTPPMSQREMLDYAAARRPGEALLEFALQADKHNRLIPPQFRRELTRRAAVPLFVHYETGHGIGLGGHVISAHEHGRLAAKLALRVLDGESAADIPPVAGGEIRVVIDHEQMRRFNIPESRLPPGAVVINRPPSILRQYRAALFALGGFVAGLSLLALFLFRANARRRQLFNQASDAIFVMDLAAVITEANNAAHTMLLRRPGDLVGKRFTDLIDPADLQVTPFQLREVLDGQTLRSQRRLVRSDGSTVTGDCHTSRLTGGRIQGIVRDVTEREEAAQALRESEERFRSVAEAVEDLVYEWRPDTDAVWRSKGAAKLLGRLPEEIEPNGRWWLRQVHPEDLERVEHQFRDALAGGDHYSIEYRLRHKNGGDVQVWDKGRVFRDPKGRVTKVVGGTTNLTQRRELEAQLRQAQKMEAIGTLAGGIAHDFNNILAGVLGNAELLRLELAPGHSGHQSVDQILKATDRARNLINQILAFSRRGDKPRQSVNLGPTLREAHRLLRSTIPVNVAVTLDSPDEPAPVVADPTQIYQSLMNLATNAWQALEPGPGRIEIIVDEADLDANAARRIGGLAAGRHLRLRVRDDGPGMTPEIRDRVFEPFFTTKTLGRGTGLGLAVVHGIIRSHHGGITLQSTPGQGAEFAIYLPVASSPPSIEAAPAAPPPDGGGRRILLVDDEEMLLKAGGRILEHLGYQTQRFIDAPAAVTAFAADPTRWDAVLTDLSMPAMTGLDLARRILDIAPDTPVILMSGYLGQMDAEEYRRKGFQDVLQKPLSIDTLGAALARVFKLTA